MAGVFIPGGCCANHSGQRFFFSHCSNLVWDVWKFWGWSLATVCCSCCYTSPCKQTWNRAPRGLAKNRHTHEKYDFSVKISRCSSWNTNKNLQWRFNHGPFILIRKWRYKISKALCRPYLWVKGCYYNIASLYGPYAGMISIPASWWFQPLWKIWV